MATLPFEYYPRTGEFVVHLEDGTQISKAVNDEQRAYQLVHSPSTGYYWIEAVGRKCLSAVMPRRNMTIDEFTRWVNDTDLY